MGDEELKQEVHQYVEDVWEDVVKDIESLVAIRSVEDMGNARPGMPYGPAPYEALSEALGIASRLGLDAHDCEGRIGYADLEGDSPKQIATIGHTDIVPEGTGWHYDPFKVTRKDGFLIGRGVLDDKGPTVLSLYAAKYFVDKVAATGRRLPYTLRCILGNNEETDMRDVEWYIENFEQPEFLFTPDADFPLICGEKGGYSATIRSGRVSDVIVDFDGGTVGNAVAGEAAAVVRASAASLPAAERIDVEEAGEGLARIVAHGIGAHASTPEGSINAIGLIVDYLLQNGLCGEGEREFLELERLVFGSTDGSTLNIAATDDLFDPLTCIGGTIRTKDGVFEQTIDSRYPKSITSDKITAEVGALCEAHHCSLTVDLDMVPFYTDPAAEGIQTLVRTYNEYTGRNDQPYTIGGGTYARHFKAGGAFGPNDPHFPMPYWVGAEHSADEGFEEAQFKRALEIYIVSIARLMELEF
ncbi:Sapep family Mn(2+)-dependent dipeptidase [Olsenella sp. DNF00959]|uniref:Sapep family Mn(2+)-dependent dipeptidase n=1 Tax=Olsenella sp. DNF00959 TaxID=1476999 RepID=UPI000783D55F|nr:Sapep family Mn(2+)-dependent dipeptidase [Olsenella sp. DNF00959]KXB62366.1 putative dipeptidase [Olsenella sp. DNF00959]